MLTFALADGFSQTLGCVPAVQGYLKALKQVCDKYGALFILDGSFPNKPFYSGGGRFAINKLQQKSCQAWDGAGHCTYGSKQTWRPISKLLPKAWAAGTLQLPGC
jgi:hypothetical protein